MRCNLHDAIKKGAQEGYHITCPTKIFPAAERDSAADVPMVTCMSQAILVMISGITPR